MVAKYGIPVEPAKRHILRERTPYELSRNRPFLASSEEGEAKWRHLDHRETENWRLRRRRGLNSLPCFL